MTVTCPFCRRDMDEDMTARIDLAGELSLACFICIDRADEAVNVNDGRDEE